MDELEKGLNNPEEKSNEPAADNAAQSDDALTQELENLRDTFQQELDKAMEESKNTVDTEKETVDMLIQQLDDFDGDEKENDEEEEKVSPDDLCKCCGEKIRDTSFGDDYPYCSECRKLMLANPLNLLGIIAMIVMVFVAGFSMSRLAVNVSSFDTLLTAEQSYKEGKYIDAASSYQSYLQSVDSSSGVSVKAVKNLADIYANLSYYSYAQQTVESYFPKARLKLSWNKKYSGYADLYSQMQAAQTSVTDNFEDVLNGGSFKYKDEIAKADKLIKEAEKSEETNVFAVTYLEYAKYIVMSRNGDSLEKQLEQLKKVEESDNGKLPLLYLMDILNVYAKMGDTENAKVYYDKLVAINKQDSLAYTYYADTFRYCKEPDADKILAIADLAKENSSSSSFPYYDKTYAIAYLLKEDYKNADESMREYIQMLSSYGSSPSQADLNLYALCAFASGDTDTYNSIKQAFDQNSVEMSKLVTQFVKNKISITEALTDNGGEIG